jgi:hypothetical protein
MQHHTQAKLRFAQYVLMSTISCGLLAFAKETCLAEKILKKSYNFAFIFGFLYRVVCRSV